MRMILLSNDSWKIQVTKHKGRGIFAQKDIKKGTIIGDYLGIVIHPRDAIIDEKNFYLMYYNDDAAIMPDLEKPGVHLLNHACFPNAWLYTYKGHTLAFALKNISKNEEITIPYLLSPKDKFCNPCVHVCKCENLKCTKNMHLSKEQYTKWQTLNKKWSAKTKKQRIRYKKALLPLPSYPKIIPQSYINSINQIFKF
jgi:uncharacterized protein